MTPRRWAWLLAVAVAAYLVLAGVRGWALLTSGQVTGVLLGVAVFALPIVGAWVVWREIAFGYAMQAMGVLLSVWWPSLVGFALGSLLVGLPFTAISFFAMQEARRLRPAQAAAFMGQLTAAYGLGQIIGPPLVALLLRRPAGLTRPRPYPTVRPARSCLTAELSPLCRAQFVDSAE